MSRWPEVLLGAFILAVLGIGIWLAVDAKSERRAELRAHGWEPAGNGVMRKRVGDGWLFKSGRGWGAELEYAPDRVEVSDE